MKYSGRSTQLR